MCGIFGYTKLTDQSRALMPYLAITMQGRGRDSWGATNGEDVFKQLGPILNTYVLSDFDDYERGVWHTRGASQGAVTIPNAHPFTSLKADGSKIIGVHNGCIYNHDELNKQYPERKFEVDSMHIYEHMAKGISLKELNGWAACVWFEDNRMNFARFNMEDLSIVELDDGACVFASTLSPIKDMCRLLGIQIEREYSLINNTHYFIEPEGELMKAAGKIEFGSRAMPVRQVPFVAPRNENYGGQFGYVSGSDTRSSQYKDTLDRIGKWARERGVCMSCNREKVDRKKAVLCASCLTKTNTSIDHCLDYYKLYV